MDREAGVDGVQEVFVDEVGPTIGIWASWVILICGL